MVVDEPGVLLFKRWPSALCERVGVLCTCNTAPAGMSYYLRGNDQGKQIAGAGYGFQTAFCYHVEAVLENIRRWEGNVDVEEHILNLMNDADAPDA